MALAVPHNTYLRQYLVGTHVGIPTIHGLAQLSPVCPHDAGTVRRIQTTLPPLTADPHVLNIHEHSPFSFHKIYS